MKSKIEKISTDTIINELNRRFASKMSEAQSIRSKIEDVFTMKNSKTNTTTPSIKKKVKRVASKSSNNEKTLPTMITEILSANQEGTSIKEVLAELENRGWQTKSTDKYNVVGAALAGDKKRFEKVSRGVYRVKTNNNEE